MTSQCPDTNAYVTVPASVAFAGAKDTYGADATLYIPNGVHTVTVGIDWLTGLPSSTTAGAAITLAATTQTQTQTSAQTQSLTQTKTQTQTSAQTQTLTQTKTQTQTQIQATTVSAYQTDTQIPTTSTQQKTETQSVAVTSLPTATTKAPSSRTPTQNPTHAYDRSGGARMQTVSLLGVLASSLVLLLLC